MKDFLDLAQSRRSVHAFEPGFQISDEVFLDLLEAVRCTPSGYNAQPWQFLLIREPENLAAIHQLAYRQDHILDAGNLVVVLGDVEFGANECKRIVEEWKRFRDFSDKQCEALHASLTKDRDLWKKREMVIRNCSLAAMSFLLAAEDKGLATCPMMGFRQLDLKHHLELPDNMLPIMMIALGKSSKPELEQLPRNEAREIGWKEKFGNKF